MHRNMRLIASRVAVATAAALLPGAVLARHRAIEMIVTPVSEVVPSGPGPAMPQPQPVQIPAGATSLEGIPTVRIDSAEGTTTRRVLDPAEATRARLTVSVVDGQFFWTTRDNRLLHLNSSGEFTYLSSEPGQYIRFTRLNDKISYVEHVDLASGSVTWFGELRIVVGNR
jgi:hypothetical protein